MNLADLKARTVELEEERDEIERTMQKAQLRDVELEALNRREEHTMTTVGRLVLRESDAADGKNTIWYGGKQLSPAGRHEIYREMGLQVVVDEDNELEINWDVCASEFEHRRAGDPAG